MNKQTVKLNYLRMTPRKVRSVADIIKGMGVNEAEAQLLFVTRRAAKPLLKLLRSGVAAAKANGMDAGKLSIASIRVDGGGMLKRYMARAQGSMAEIQKKMSHVTLVLSENPKVKNTKFTIVVPKKVKHLGHEEGGKKPQKKEKEVERTPREKKTGFFKRVFGRNTNNRGVPNKTGA